MNEVYDKMKSLIIECGNILIDKVENIEIDVKDGNNNIVTNYDILIQNKLKNELLKLIPDSCFIGEENDFNYKDSEYMFIVDPIDGTTNFSRNLNMSSISIALLKNNEVIIGLCYNPYSKELYEARKGMGSFLNGKKITVSDKLLKNGIALCGCSPYYDDLRKKSIEISNKLILNSSDFRRFGSAVIELCNIASGKAEVYFELKLMPWDYAAASLIVEEAGGLITTIEGDKIQFKNPSSILASNNKEDYLKYIEGEV